MKPISDEMLERLGNYYCSELVAKQMPWIKERPFHVWLDQYLIIRQSSTNYVEIGRIV